VAREEEEKGRNNTLKTVKDRSEVIAARDKRVPCFLIALD
jgi:hypothetical protein